MPRGLKTTLKKIALGLAAMTIVATGVACRARADRADREEFLRTSLEAARATLGDIFPRPVLRGFHRL